MRIDGKYTKSQATLMSMLINHKLARGRPRHPTLRRKSNSNSSNKWKMLFHKKAPKKMLQNQPHIVSQHQKNYLRSSRMPDKMRSRSGSRSLRNMVSMDRSTQTGWLQYMHRASKLKEHLRGKSISKINKFMQIKRPAISSFLRFPQ